MDMCDISQVLHLFSSLQKYQKVQIKIKLERQIFHSGTCTLNLEQGKSYLLLVEEGQVNIRHLTVRKNQQYIKNDLYQENIMDSRREKLHRFLILLNGKENRQIYVGEDSIQLSVGFKGVCIQIPTQYKLLQQIKADTIKDITAAAKELITDQNVQKLANLISELLEPKRKLITVYQDECEQHKDNFDYFFLRQNLFYQFIIKVLETFDIETLEVIIDRYLENFWDGRMNYKENILVIICSVYCVKCKEQNVQCKEPSKLRKKFSMSFTDNCISFLCNDNDKTFTQKTFQIIKQNKLQFVDLEKYVGVYCTKIIETLINYVAKYLCYPVERFNIYGVVVTHCKNIKLLKKMIQDILLNGFSQYCVAVQKLTVIDPLLLASCLVQIINENMKDVVLTIKKNVSNGYLYSMQSQLFVVITEVAKYVLQVLYNNYNIQINVGVYSQLQSLQFNAVLYPFFSPKQKLQFSLIYQMQKYNLTDLFNYLNIDVGVKCTKQQKNLAAPFCKEVKIKYKLDNETEIVDSNKKQKQLESNDTCCVCFGTTEEGIQLASMPCAHTICLQCIKSMRINHCPLCKQEYQFIKIGDNVRTKQLQEIINTIGETQK